MARHALTVAGLGQHAGVMAVSMRLGVPVVGLGASAACYYPAVGVRLGTTMILREHAGVANAIGAVVGQVTQRVTGLVSSPAEGRFVAHLASGLVAFADREAALSAMEAALGAEVRLRAQAAGAADMRVTVVRDVREAQVEGRAMFVEATVTATASGRPRVAHMTESA